MGGEGTPSLRVAWMTVTYIALACSSALELQQVTNLLFCKGPLIDFDFDFGEGEGEGSPKCLRAATWLVRERGDLPRMTTNARYASCCLRCTPPSQISTHWHWCNRELIVATFTKDRVLHT